MAYPDWCSMTEVEDILSAAGVEQATNDDGSNAVADPVIVANAIARARLKLSQYLIGKYDITTITSDNEYIKWATATFAAVELMRRKGGAVPAGLQEMSEELTGFLVTVQTGSGQVPDLNFRTTPGIGISNVTIDNRYNRAKIRVVETISWPGMSKVQQFRDRFDVGIS